MQRSSRGMVLILLTIIGLVLFTACTDKDGELAVAQPTSTEAVTATPPPTNTASPLPTDTPEPTATTEPTNTPEPTATAEPTASPTSEPQSPHGASSDEGLSRANPVPPGELVHAPNWDIQVVEVVRGDEAWSMLEEADDWNEPPRDGMQYVLVRLGVTCTYDDDDSHYISSGDFRLTGDALRQYWSSYVTTPDPELDFELFAGARVEGWIVFEAPEDEAGLILVLDELANFDEDRYRYLALEEGASYGPDHALGDITPTDVGRTRGEPAALGQVATTQDWQIAVNEVVRGDEAWAMVQAADDWNDPPADGMEYVAMKIWARNVSMVESAEYVDSASFGIVGSANVVYDQPAYATLLPDLDMALYPGGEHEGWLVLTIPEGEDNLLLAVEPFSSWDGEGRRYFALSEGAAHVPVADVAETEPNDVGTSRSEPAALGETVITDDWEVQVVEAYRGEDAWAMLSDPDLYNDPPEPGMEYVVAKVHVRCIGTSDEAYLIDVFDFRTTGDNAKLYDPPIVSDPEPALDVGLYPGGSYAGWVSLQVAEDETGIMLVFEPWLSFGDERRFLSLEG